MLDFERELGKAVKYFWQIRGKQKKRQGGKTGKKKAITAVARKLAVLLHRLWFTGEEYDPLRVSRRRERSLQKCA